MSEISLTEAMRSLASAEEFLDYFNVSYDPHVVEVNRLHILQRFHDYLEANREALPADEAGRREFHLGWLARAYQDFVESDARTEKVFKVFRRDDPKPVVFVPLASIFK